MMYLIYYISAILYIASFRLRYHGHVGKLFAKRKSNNRFEEVDFSTVNFLYKNLQIHPIVCGYSIFFYLSSVISVYVAREREIERQLPLRAAIAWHIFQTLRHQVIYVLYDAYQYVCMCLSNASIYLLNECLGETVMLLKGFIRLQSP